MRPIGTEHHARSIKPFSGLLNFGDDFVQSKSLSGIILASRKSSYSKSFKMALAVEKKVLLYFLLL
jgi:hypothetical protein